MKPMIQKEVLLCCSGLGLGMFLMLIYDGLRLFRILLPHKTFWTGMEDLCYWLASGILVFSLLFYFNDGILRAYAIGAVLFGMLFWDLTFSRILMWVLKKAGKYFTIKRRKNGVGLDGRNETKPGTGNRTQKKE